MIQKGRVTNRKQKLISQQVYLATTSPPATPEYLNWSDEDVGKIILPKFLDPATLL